MNEVLFIILILVIAGLALFVVPQWRLRRAISQVIRIFTEFNAIDIKNAKTIDELGLRPRTLMEGMFRGRDYKPHALRALIKAEIIQMTEDGRLYLSEEKLITSGLYRSISGLS